MFSNNLIPPCSSMSYMELKRRHQELLSEIAALEGKSREQEESHWAQVNQFTKEIEESKVRDVCYVCHCCIFQC